MCINMINTIINIYLHTKYKNNIALAKASVDEDVRSWLQGKTVSYIVQPSLYIDIRPQNATTGPIRIKYSTKPCNTGV